MEYDNTNSGVLFKNESDNEKAPAYKGKLNVDGKCLPVLAASITFYVPDDVVVYLSGSDMKLPRHKTINLLNEASNFGDAFNAVMGRAFQDFD